MINYMKSIAAIAIAVIMFSATSFAGVKANEKLNDSSIKAYIQGIKSENDGLRKSAIFYAGLYQIKEAKETLLHRYSSTDDINEKIMIALSLYLIQEPDAFAILKNTALIDRETKFNELTADVYEIFAGKLLQGMKQ